MLPSAARSFQVLARESGQQPLNIPRRNPLQQLRSSRASPPCRTFHGSGRAPAQEAASTNSKHEEEEEQEQDVKHPPPPPPSPNPTNHPLAELVRKTMRRVPQPVTIVTSSSANTPKKQSGATISSFNTVTLHPEPIISFNIKALSATFDAIRASGKLRVYFLAQTPAAVPLAEAFTRRDPSPLLLERKDEKEGQVAFVLDCVYLHDKTVEVGDHVVLFAAVSGVMGNDTLDARIAEGSDNNYPQRLRPTLVYVDGEYQGVAPLEK